MKLTIAESKYLKDSISIISDIVTEARFKVNKDGVELVAMDPANVAMVIFKLLSSAFTEYDVKQDTDIAINLGNLKQILRRAGLNDLVTLEVTKDNKLQVQLRGASTRTFSIPIIELEEKEQKVPELEFPVKVQLPGSMLNEAIEDADIVAESVTFNAEENKFTIAAQGDLNKASIEMEKGDDVSITAKVRAKAKYSVEYLKKMITGSKISDKVSVQFSNDYPLRLEYTKVNMVQLVFILAPRVENE